MLHMIVNKDDHNYEDPPDIPLITGGAKKVPRRESLTEAVTGADLAFAKAVSTPTKQKPVVTVPSGVSPLTIKHNATKVCPRTA